MVCKNGILTVNGREKEVDEASARRERKLYLIPHYYQ